MKSCPSCQALCHDKARFCPSCGANVAEAQASDADPFVGHTLADKYLIKKLIGEGGMGRVYEAEQLALEKPVAVKVLHQHLLGDDHSVARFVAEAKEASRLNHPNIVSVIEFGETAYNVMFIVMEYLRGKPLADIIADEYPLSFRRVVKIFRQVLLAISAAHQLGVLHRDLKPDNVFIEELADGSERVKVIDFGIAKRFDTDEQGLTSPGMVCGTPEYMSPEQVTGDPLDPRSDVYALGILLYEMLVGTPPFLGKTPAEVMIMQAEDEPLSPSHAAAEQPIPASMDAIVLWALAKDRDERLTTAEEFRRVLDSWLLVSVQEQNNLEGTIGVTCPSCNAFNVEHSGVCVSCGFRLPKDQPAEGMPYLRESLGEKRFNQMRESQSIKLPQPLDLDELTLTTTPGTAQAVQPGRRVLRYVPLLGRELELARLLQMVDTGGPLRLVGEAGIGKSRLLDELASRARDGGFEVTRLTPRDDPQFPTPQWVLRTMTAALLGPEAETLNSPEALQSAARKIELPPENLAGLEVVFGVPRPLNRQLSRSAQRREVRAALRALVTARARQKPVALLMEDLEQMDAPSRRMVEYLQTIPAQERILVVSSQTDHPDDADAVPQLVIRALGRDDAEALGTQKQQGHDLSPEALALLDMAGGNPFFVDQLVRLEQEGGLPGRLKRRIELLDARLDRLPIHLRQLLQRLAVHGGRVPIDRLTAAFEYSLEELDAQVVALEDMGLVDTSTGWVSPSHALVEDAVLAGMPAEIRREAHERYLAGIAQITPQSIGEAIRHALGTDDDQYAADLLEVGASVAWSGLDADRAVQWLQLALQKSRLLWGRGDLGMEAHTRITVELGRRLAEVLRQRGDTSTSEAVLREVQSFVSLEQPSLAAAIAMDQSRHVLTKGNIATAEEQLEQALRLSMQDEEATWLHCELIYRLGEISSRRGQYDRALSLFSEGFDLAQQLDAGGYGEAWRFQVALGEICRGEGKLEEAEAYYDEAIMTAERSGSIRGMLMAQRGLTELLRKQGNQDRARDHLADAVRHAERLGDRGVAAELSLKAGHYAELARDYKAASEHYKRGRQWAEEVDLDKLIHLADKRLRQVAEAAESE